MTATKSAQSAGQVVLIRATGLETRDCRRPPLAGSQDGRNDGSQASVPSVLAEVGPFEMETGWVWSRFER